MPNENENDVAWYVVNTYAGQENRVKENLEKRIKTMGLEDSLFQVVVAEETETEYKNGKKIEKTHNLFSGYILVQMRMTNEAWYIVRNTFQVVVAEETETEYKNGKKIEKTHNLFSGYILVQMRMTNEAWYIVRNTPGVTGFIGSSGKGAKPFPVSQAEVDNVLRRLGKKPEVVNVNYVPGDKVEVIGGPLKDNIVTVVSMNPEAEEAKVSVYLLGKEQLVDVNFADLKKVED